MAKIYIPLAQGFEESEFSLPYDIMHRAGLDVTTVSISDNLQVTSSHGLTVTANTTLAKCDMSDGDLIFLPGGMPGAVNLSNCTVLNEIICDYAQAGKYLTAVCAGPMVYGLLGLLKGKKATCFPGFEDKLIGAERIQKTLVHDGKFITGCGAGAAFAMGAKIVELLISKEKADTILKQMMYRVYPE